MKISAFIFFVFINISLVSAQNIVSGKITDESGNPLIGCNVFINDLNKGTVTDSEGKYSLINLPEGKFKIQFSFIGYNTKIVQTELKNNHAELNTTLYPVAIETAEIVVSGAYNFTQHENAVKIDLLKLNENSTKSTPNFMEKITKVPGVDMISKGSGISKPVIRGLSMNDVLSLNNSVRFENYQYSSHHPLGIDEFGIEEVEIIKGPASLLYGSDAIGGVINFIKEKPAPIGNLEGDYNLQMFSNTQGISNNLGAKASLDKFFGGIRFGQKSNSDYLQGGGKFVPNSRANELSFKSNLGFTDNFGSFQLFYDYNNQKLGLVEDEAIELISKRGNTNSVFYQELTNHLLSSRNKIYLANFKIDMNAAFQSAELVHFGEKNIYEIQMRLGTLTYETKVYLPSDDKTDYILGVQGINQSNKNLNDREVILLPNAEINGIGAFALYQHEFFNKLRFQSGLRYDTKKVSTNSVGELSDTDSYRPALDKSYHSFSGSIGASYSFTESLILRTNFASAYRSPNLAELTSNGQHELIYETGDANLRSENSYELDLSIHYHKENFTFDIAGFINNVNDFIFIAPMGLTTTNGIPVYKYRQSDAKLYGGEAGLHVHPSSVKWLHFETTFASVIGKQNNGEYLPFISANKFRVDIRAESPQIIFLKNAYVSINSTFVFDQNNAAPNETPTKGYSLFDFSLGGKIQILNSMISLNLSVNNIFDRKYIDHLSTLKEVNYFNPGRNFTFTLSIPFNTNI